MTMESKNGSGASFGYTGKGNGSGGVQAFPTIGSDNTQTVYNLLEENKRLREAVLEFRERSQQLIDRWNSPKWKELPHTADYIHSLRFQVKQTAWVGGL